MIRKKDTYFVLRVPVLDLVWPRKMFLNNVIEHLDLLGLAAVRGVAHTGSKGHAGHGQQLFWFNVVLTDSALQVTMVTDTSSQHCSP